jgi:eukaryotic-like serine/threonine-protein kinase
MEETKRLFLPIRFGIFEVDLQAGELRKQGYKVKLQEQPFQLLIMLLDRSGDVVTREELQKKLWPADTFVDFERGLNRAINKLREALGDDADSPRFVETLPRRGYRFVAPVETPGPREPETPGRNRLVLIQPDLPYLPHKVENNVSTAVAPRRQVLPWAVAGMIAIVALFAYWKQWRAPQIVVDRPFVQFDLDVSPSEFTQPAISPDGMRIVFVSKGSLAIRRLDQTKTTQLAGTEGAFLPFFSPNGQWVAFFAAHKLQKVAVEGGAPITLCDATSPGGGSWGDDDNIVAALNGNRGLSQIVAAGGASQPLTDAKSDSSGARMHLWPQMLPGGKGVLFAAINGSGQGSLRILAPNGKIRTIVENSTQGRYLASGYLIYYRQATLFAAPMDPSRLELTGPPVTLVSGVSNDSQFGPAEFDLSNSGTLVYRGGTAGTSFVLSWLYASGKTEPVLPKPGSFSSFRLSPDGRRLAVSVIQDSEQKLWVYDLTRETWTRLTSDAVTEYLPTWTPDGEFLAFRSGNTLAWTRSDGSGTVERLAGVSANAGPWSFSADGKWLAFWPLQPGSDLWIVPVERSPGSLRLGVPHPLLQQAGSKGAPAISPDNRWLAYTSDESGRFEIYVMPFSPQTSGLGRKWTISNGGGTTPIWSPNGRELFYAGSDRRIQVASYTVKGDSFLAEKPRVWSETRQGMHMFPILDVAPDGKRVLALFAANESSTETFVRVMLNVDSELHRRAPQHSN